VASISAGRAVVLGAKILARVLVINGQSYVKKFADKTGGFTLMKNRLRHWWNTPGIWTICFAILFDRDVATIDFERDFDVFNLVDIFIMRSPQSKLKICHPEIFAVISAMLDTGLRAIVRDRETQRVESTSENGDAPVTRGRRRTMSLNAKQPTVGMLLHHSYQSVAYLFRHESSTVRAIERLCCCSQLCYTVPFRASIPIRSLQGLR
jgi:hypothetical protein